MFRCNHHHQGAHYSIFDLMIAELVSTDMSRLAMGIRSEKCVLRRFRRCANVYLHQPRQYSIAYYTPMLYGIAYCCYATNLYSMLLY